MFNNSSHQQLITAKYGASGNGRGYVLVAIVLGFHAIG